MTIKHAFELRALGFRLSYCPYRHKFVSLRLNLWWWNIEFIKA